MTTRPSPSGPQTSNGYRIRFARSGAAGSLLSATLALAALPGCAPADIDGGTANAGGGSKASGGDSGVNGGPWASGGSGGTPDPQSGGGAGNTDPPGGGGANTDPPCAGSDCPPTVDPNATQETKALFAQLRALAPNKLLIGMEDALGRGEFMKVQSGYDWELADGVKSDVRTICGKGPAIVGFDVAGIVGDWWIGNPDIESLMAGNQARTRDFMQKQHARGGINTMAWHQSNPMTGEDYHGGPHELWRIVPPEACPQLEAKVSGLSGCGSHFEVFKKKFLVLANWMLTVVDTKGRPIPIILRPFHENNGGWFWWGADGVDATLYQASLQAVWSWMVETMQDQGVHQVLWAISPNGTGGWQPLTESAYLGFSPSLDLVDVLGYDFYAKDLSGSDAPSWGSGALQELSMLVDLAAKHDKVAAMTEGGATGGIDDGYGCQFWTQSQIGPILKHAKARGIAYYLMWANFPNGPKWGPVPGDCSGDVDFKAICDMPETLLEGEADFYGTGNGP